MPFPPHDALAAFLAKTSSRTPLGANERLAILDLPTSPRQVARNRDIVRHGDMVDHATLVVSGLVGSFGQNREGNRQITGLLIEGDMANLNAVVAPRAGVPLQALADTEILKIPHHSLRDIVARFPAIAKAFWAECAVDAAILTEWVINLGRRDAKTRLAHLLCEMACRTLGCGGGAPSFSFAFPVTQAHLADMLGLTAVHLNRTLKAIKQDRIATMSGRTVEVLDWSRLMELGEFDLAYLQLANPDQWLQQRAVA